MVATLGPGLLMYRGLEFHFFLHSMMLSKKTLCHLRKSFLCPKSSAWINLQPHVSWRFFYHSFATRFQKKWSRQKWLAHLSSSSRIRSQKCAQPRHLKLQASSSPHAHCFCVGFVFFLRTVRTLSVHKEMSGFDQAKSWSMLEVFQKLRPGNISINPPRTACYDGYIARSMRVIDCVSTAAGMNAFPLSNTMNSKCDS